MQCRFGTALLLLIQCTLGTGFSPLEIAARLYGEGERVEVYTDALISETAVFSYPAYSLRGCAPPADLRQEAAEMTSIGEFVFGDRMEPTMMSLRALHDVTCSSLCAPFTLTEGERRLYVRRIEARYRAQLIIDDMPAVQAASLTNPRGAFLGYAVGQGSQETKTKNSHLNNHVHLTVYYNRLPKHAGEKIAIVGLVASEYSIAHSNPRDCGAGKGFDPNTEIYAPLSLDHTSDVMFSYSVKWEPVPISWMDRLQANYHLPPSDLRRHWAGVTNTGIVLAGLCCMMLVILVRILKGDLEDQDMSQWKLCHADVFRPPPFVPALAVLVGTGTQLLAAGSITLLLGTVGYLSSARRGAVLTVGVVVYQVVGVFGGYVAARLSSTTGQRHWGTIACVAVCLPAVAFVVYALVALVQGMKNLPDTASSTFSVIGGMLFVWAAISVPLVLLGGLVGYRQPVWAVPTPASDVPRRIPPLPISATLITLLVGLLPYQAMHSDLDYCLRGVWQGKAFHVLGHVTLSSVMCIATASLSSAVATFVLLCRENYNWWWRSFFFGGATGLYFALFAANFYNSSLHVTRSTGAVLYFSCMILLSTMCALAVGTASFFASFSFLRIIYGTQEKKGS